MAGELDLPSARALERQLESLELQGTDLVLDLADLELDSGPACAAAVDAVRALVRRGCSVTLVQAPQALAHVLYRVAMTDRVRLVDVRWEEPTVT